MHDPISLRQFSSTSVTKSNAAALDVAFGVSMIVVQPTTFCNLDCTYCYLHERSLRNRMQVAVSSKIAEYIACQSDPIRIAWHGGEPTAVGLDTFLNLYEPLSPSCFDAPVRHNIQTNATLLDDPWCEFLATERFEVGISIDGPSWMNHNRRYRNGRPAFDAISRGIDCLRKHNVPFGMIAVLTEESLSHARELYEFAKSVGTHSLCVNVEEKEGSNQAQLLATSRVHSFWRTLFDVWRADSTAIRVREFSRMLEAMSSDDAQATPRPRVRHVDLFPSVATTGNVVLLSPELLNARPNSHYHFIVGNIMEESLHEILSRGPQTNYVCDFIRGMRRCAAECDYFGLCHGGQASNKFFENNDIATTETIFCRNHKQYVIDAILDSLESNDVPN